MMIRRGEASSQGVYPQSEWASSAERGRISTFKIITEDSMGIISGVYSVLRDDKTVKIELIPSDGWTPVPNSLLTKVMFGKKSVFCNWPKTYKYTQNVDLSTLNSTSYWERIK